jgi:hypothetical protein
MQRPISMYILIAILLAAALYVTDRFYPNWFDALQNRLWPTEQSMDSETTEAEFAGFINANQDSRLVAAIGRANSEDGLAIFTDDSSVGDRISTIIITGHDETTALLKISRDGWPNSLEVDNHLLLFDDHTTDTVNVTIRQPDRTYKYLQKAPVNWPANHPLQPPALADTKQNLQAKLPGNFNNYLLAGSQAITNAVSCIEGLLETLPSFSAGEPLSWLGCGNWSINPEEATRAALLDCIEINRDCGHQAIRKLSGDNLTNDTLMSDEPNDTAEESEDNETAQEHESQPPPFVSDYMATFSHQAENDRGLNEVDSGLLALVIDEETANCILTAESTLTGVPNTPEGSPADTQLPNVALSSKSVSTFCSGRFDSVTGLFELEGTVQTDMTAQTNELGEVLTSGMGPFHVIGAIENERLSGTLFFSNKAIELISYEIQ